MWFFSNKWRQGEKLRFGDWGNRVSEEMDESSCFLGEAQYFKDDKQDGIKRGNSVIGEFRFFQN